MTTIKEISTIVATKYNEGVSIDPATIIMLMSLVTEIIKMWQDCKQEPEQALLEAKNPGLFQRLLVRRVVKDMMGRRDFRKYGDSLVDAVIKTGSEITVEQLKLAYAEVNSEG